MVQFGHIAKDCDQKRGNWKRYNAKGHKVEKFKSARLYCPVLEGDKKGSGKYPYFNRAPSKKGETVAAKGKAQDNVTKMIFS